MRKLTLNVDALTVETFRADAAGPDGRGTVHGQQETSPFRCTQLCTYNCTGIPCFATARPAC